MPEPLKVVLIGAASPQWGFIIARDIIVNLSDEKVCSAQQPVFVLEDVDPTNLALITELARRVAKKAGNRVTVESTTDQKKALAGAGFVVVSFAVGSREAMQYDLEIPQEYGIFQPVGDTVSIGGALRAARNIPALVGIARDMEQLAAPGAWLLNLANPMSMLCRAVTRETNVNTIGCCHELYGGVHFMSQVLGFPYQTWRQDIKLRVLGVNHCGWMQQLEIGGQDGLALLKKTLAAKGIVSETNRLYNSDSPELAHVNVKINLFLRYGVLPFSGDRHTSEFFTEFVNKGTNKGADYGVLLTSPQERLVSWRGRARVLIKKMLAGQEAIDLNVSPEAVSRIIKAMVLDEPFYDIGNIPYRGSELARVPQGAVLERMITYRRNKAVPDPLVPLPQPVHDHLVHITTFIEDIVEASVTGNRQLLLAALERDLLLANMPKQQIPEMLNRLLTIHKQWVHPGFF